MLQGHDKLINTLDNTGATKFIDQEKRIDEFELKMEKKLALELTDSERDLLTSVFSVLENSALAQKQVSVHRDYHARNLMVLDQGLGVIDFQDAVQGPMTYDLVSLLKDCYIHWPADAVAEWRDYYLQEAKLAELLPEDYSKEKFRQEFDLMGAQRHIKVLGTFARLYLPDGKEDYLDDLRMVSAYVEEVLDVDAPQDEQVKVRSLAMFTFWTNFKGPAMKRF